GGANRGGGGRGGFDPATRFAQMDVDGDGALTGAELTERHKGTDLAADGKLTKDEFLQLWERMRAGMGGGSGRHGGCSGGPSGRHGGGGHGGHGHGGGHSHQHGGNPSEDAAFLVSLDGDRDRLVATDEVSAAIVAAVKTAAETRMAKDTDEDGAVSAEEYASVPDGESPVRGARRRFAREDADGDGSLSADEAKLAARAEIAQRARRLGLCLHLAGIDADGDGSVSPAERQANGKANPRVSAALANLGEEPFPTDELCSRL
ncbi:MAG: hypothetical protein AAF907_11950, partial [Planctomycetota bacterium]